MNEATIMFFYIFTNIYFEQTNKHTSLQQSSNKITAHFPIFPLNQVSLLQDVIFMYMLSEIIILLFFLSDISCHKFYTEMTNKFVRKKNKIFCYWNTSFANFLNNFLHFFLLNAESMNQNTLLIHPLNQYKREREEAKNF